MRLAPASLLLAAIPAFAQVPAQAPVCQTAQQCVSIVERHGPQEFDYSVLAGEFRRLGPRGERALLALAQDPDTARRAFGLARRDAAGQALRDALHARFPLPDPDLHIRLARAHPSAVLQGRAVAALDDPQTRAAGLEALQALPASLPLAAGERATLLRLLPTIPDAALVERVGAEASPQTLTAVLARGDADAVVAAFLAWERRDAAAAAQALERAFRASAPERAATWVEALERIGRDSQTFDAVGFGHRLFPDSALPLPLRAAALHSALLYPATAERAVAASAAPLLPALLALPVSDRLADSAASHPLFRDPDRLEQLANVWSGRDTEASARLVRAVADAAPPGARAILRGLFERSPDFRVQVAVLQALGRLGTEDRLWIARATRAHPILAVREAGAEALGERTARPAPACFARGPRRRSRADEMPFFEGGRIGGEPAERWRLVDAAPVRGGWLGAYRDGVVLYPLQGAPREVEVEGQPIAVLADPTSNPAERAPVAWILAQGPSVARLYRFDAATGTVSTPLVLPRDAFMSEVPDAPRPVQRGWVIAFRGGEQPTLTLSRDGRLLPLCAPPPRPRGLRRTSP